VPRPKQLREAKPIMVVLDLPLLEEAKAAARSKGVSLSQLIREALEAYLQGQAAQSASVSQRMEKVQDSQVSPETLARIRDRLRLAAEESGMSPLDYERFILERFGKHSLEELTEKEAQYILKLFGE